MFQSKSSSKFAARLAAVSLLSAVALTTTLEAQAALDFTVTASGGGGGNNMGYNPCTAPILGPSLTIQGCLLNDTTKLINATGTENFVANGGQARVEAQDGAFTFAKIDPLNFLASEFIMNINTVQGQSGSVVFSDVSGSSASFAVGNGSNFFTITGLTALDFVSVTATGFSIQDIRQIRVTPGTNTPVPLPGALALMFVGLVGLFGARKFRK